MTDKIAEIRARHALSASWSTGYSDRATLLAEVDRQRAEIEQLRDEDTKTRHALKGWVFVCPDGGDEPTHERVAAVVAEVDRLRAENELLRAEIERLTRECAAEWEPIETAPRDGTTILVYFRRHGPMTVVASDQDDPDADWRPWYIDDHKHGPYVVRGYRQGDDTHWMPLPEPPKALEGKP